MGLFKRCECKKTNRNKCPHPWHGGFRGFKVSLTKWADREVKTKDDAKEVMEKLSATIREAMREGQALGLQRAKGPAGENLRNHVWKKLNAGLDGPTEPKVELLTFRKFADLFEERYVKRAALKSADTVAYRLVKVKAHFGDRLLTDIKAADIEDFLAGLLEPTLLHPKHKALRQRGPATVNRWRSLLVRMFSWAVEQDYLERTPCAKVGVRKSLITKRREPDARNRRLSDDEVQSLFGAVNPTVKLLMIVAIQTGMRQGEMLEVRWRDLDVRPGWIHLRASITKTGRERFIPIHPKVQAVFDYLRVDADGEKKPADGQVFSNECGERIGCFNTAWRNAKRRAGIQNLRWHDLRHEFASRLLEEGANIIQARDLLGHTDVKTTQRYLNQTDDQLMNAVNRLKDPTQTKADDQAAPEQPAPEVAHQCHVPTDTPTPAVTTATASTLIC